jgi:hypothetical protein
MTITELIEEILNEWAYRLEDGTPNVKNPKHIKVLDVVLSELCLNEVKDLIIENLQEADKTFSNPILNKKVKYKNANGEDTEGIVGNLLRQPEGSPGRDAAEKLLPPEGSPERDDLNKDLGGEGQPTKPEDEKGKEGGGEAGGGEDEKAKAAAAMFDPKADPAMAARMDTEKDTLAKIAKDTEADKQVEPPKEEPKETPKKKDGPAGGPGAETPKQEPGRPDTTPPEEAPSEPAKREPANDDPESKAQKFKGKKSGEEIQTMEMEGGGFVYGTKHGNTAMVDDILDDVKSKIPKERWGDIVFVGEGGATNDETGEIDFNDEMDYAAPKFKELGAGVDTWDGDDMDVHKSDSKLYQKQKEKTGLKDNQVLAGNWASMVGQGEGEGLDPNDPEHSMKAEDYLDDEGKQFLQDAAKEAGLPPIEDFDNPTGEKPSEENGWKGTGDRGTLYRLAFPDDNGDKPTKINDIQVAFNDARDEHLIEKNKELTAQGKIPITIAGESHVDLVDKMTRKSSDTKPEQPSAEKPEQPSAEKPEETPTDAKPEQPSAEKPEETPTDAKPEEKPAKKDFSKEEPGQEATASGGKRIYSIGGGYYSDKKGGPAKYVRTESIVDMAFEDVITEDVFALFEKTISATLANGETIKVSELPPRAQKKATDKAKAAAKSSAEQPAAKKTDGTDVPGKFTPIKTPPPANEKGVEKDGKIAGTTIETEPSLKDADPEFLKQKSTEMNKYYENFKEDKKKAEGIAREKLGYSEEQVKELKGDEKKAYDDEVKKNQAPTYNLCKVSVPGTNLFCAGNKGIPRAKMPQFKGEPREGTQAWDVLQKAKESDPTATEADGEPYFRQMLADKGVKVTDAEVPSESLKATQSELVGDKVLGMKSVLDAGPSHPAYKKMTAPLYVSKDGYVVDGHHRWAAITAYNMEHPDNPLPLKAMIIDQDIDQAIETSNDFADEFGVAAKSGKQTGADANKEQPAQQKPAQQKPAKPTKNKKATLSPKEKYKQQARDNRIQAKKDQAADRAADGDTAPKGPSAFGQVPDNLPKKDVKTAIKDGVKNWSEKEKSFFKEKVHKGNSPERRSWGQAIRDKAKGAIAAIKKGVKHEIEEFKAAGVGLKNFFSGKPVSEHEQKALKAVGIKIITTALFGAAFGGLAHGAVAFAQHVAIEFIPHVIGETILKGVGTAAIFAGPEEENEDILMEKFMGMIAEKMASEKIPAELMLEMIESYNAKKETKKEIKIESLIREIIFEIKSEAKSRGGESKEYPGYFHIGGGYYSTKAGGDITHKVVDGGMKLLSAKEKAEKNKNQTPATKPPQTVATDKDLQARVGREKAALDKEKDKKSTTPSGKLPKKMEEDDVFFSKDAVERKATEADTKVDSLPTGDKEKAIIKGVIRKVLKGEGLTANEIKVASDWITFPATSDVKIYFASEAGNFKDHDKVVISSSMSEEAREQFNEFLENNEVFDAGHPVKKKSMVASKLTPKRTFTKVENVKKDKEGNATSVTVGNTTLERITLPTEKELIKEFKKQGIENPEQEAKDTIVAIERHNANVNFLASQKDIETIDFGHDTNSSEGRRDTIESIKKLTAKKLLDDFTKYYKGKANIPKEARNILNLINNLSNPYINPSGNAAEKLQQEIDAIAILMNNNPDFRAGVPDMQEIFDFVVKLGQGYAGFMPSASNWKVTDIVTYKPTQSFKFKKGESPAEAIAKNLQTFKSTVLIEGGSSVKYEKGGASAGLDKILMTVYNKHKGFDTQKELVKLFDTYQWSFTPGEESRVKSEKEIQAKEAELNDTLNRAIAVGIISSEEKKEILAEGEKQAAAMAAKVEKKVPFEKYKQCFGKTPEEQNKNYNNYKKQLGLWCKMGAMAEVINNNDARYQLFGNLRTKYPKKGAPKHEVIDGVSVLSGMGWSYDPGISATGKDCKYISMNNANSSHIEPIKRKR